MSIQKESQLAYTLGLDIGIASVGAAILGEDRILNLHVRTFDRAETAKEGESLNKIRRDSRLTRRRIRRRAHRLLRLRNLFERHGLINSTATSSFTTGLSPWQLRAEGLDRKLEKAEFAAALYHLVKHRGFQSNRKSEANTDEKAGKMLSGVSKNRELLNQSIYRTMGEMAARHEAFSKAKRNKGGNYTHTFSRVDLEEELQLIFSCQREASNPHASQELEDGVHSLLMQRRPALSGVKLLEMVGSCTFEPDEYRAPKASYRAERFIWLTKINNLRISDMGEVRALNEEERQLLLPMPYNKVKLTYKQVRNNLGLTDSVRFVGLRYPRGNDQSKDPEKGALFEAQAFHTLRKVYSNAGLKLEWQRDSQNVQRLDDIGYALTVFKVDDEARYWLREKGIESAIIEAVLNVSFSDFLRLSSKALSKILPYMEEGERYDEAVKMAGYSHHSQLGQSHKTPYIPRFSRRSITNPVVARALNQARKLVNAIVREYGPPKAVHIELARDLSRPMDERRKIEKEQKQYQTDKVEDIERFETTFGSKPRKDQLTKWRLYREQLGQCCFSQRPIDLNRLCEEGYLEIDHALPYSRSFNDGMNNKVLVHTEENRNKGNKTPFEYLDGKNDSERWLRFSAWVRSNKNYRVSKQRNLLRKDFGIEAAKDFRERHLTDTRYIAKEFKRMVETHLSLAEGSDEKSCVVVSGQLTSYLRTRWGLIKERKSGDLHHALDAIVVAASTRSMVQRLSNYSRKNEIKYARSQHVDPETGEVIDIDALRKLEDDFPRPWDHFRKEVIAWLSSDPAKNLSGLPAYCKEALEGIKAVRVSRAPTRRGIGPAHEETIRSAKYLTENKSTVKTPLENLKLKDLPNIVGFADPRNKPLMEAIRNRLQEHNNDGKKAFSEALHKPSAIGKDAPRVRNVKLFTIQKSGTRVRGGVANNGTMVRVDIFTKNKKFFAVPIYVSDTVKSELPSRAVAANKPETAWTEIDTSYDFLFSLHKNDWVSVVVKDGSVSHEGYFAQLDRATGAISLWVHDRDQSVGKDGLIRGIGIKTARSLKKYHVDLLGNLHCVHHEIRQPLTRKG